MPKNYSLFQDEAGNYSNSRVIPFSAWIVVLGLVIYACIIARKLAEIPPSYIQLLGAAVVYHLGAKGLMLGVGKVDPAGGLTLSPLIQGVSLLNTVAPLKAVKAENASEAGA